MRSMMCEEDFTAEVIPVDQAINGLIGIAYTVSTMKSKLVLQFHLGLTIVKFLHQFISDQTIFQFSI